MEKPTASRKMPQTPAETASNFGFMGVAPAQTKWFELMTETTRFLVERMQQDLEAQQAFLKSRSSQELMALQTEYVKTALEQYMAQTTRLAEMMSGSTKQVLSELTPPHARKYDDVPL